MLIRLKLTILLLLLAAACGPSYEVESLSSNETSAVSQGLTAPTDTLYAARFPHGFGRHEHMPPTVSRATLNPGSGEFSVGFWFRADPRQGENPATIPLIGKGNHAASDGGFRLFLERTPNGNYELVFRVAQYPGRVIAVARKSVSLRRWYHVVAVIDRPGPAGDDRNQLRMYLNGQLEPITLEHPGETRFLTRGSTIESPQPLRIGWTHDTATGQASDLRGYVDQVRIYGRAISRELDGIDEVEALFAEPRDLTESIVFERTPEYCYRIPVVVRAPDGALVAMAERRHGWKGAACSDNGNHDIVMRISRDHGQHWSSEVVVVDHCRYVSSATCRSADGDYAAAELGSPVITPQGHLMLFFSMETKKAGLTQTVAMRKLITLPFSWSTGSEAELVLQPDLDTRRTAPSTIEPIFGPGHGIVKQLGPYAQWLVVPFYDNGTGRAKAFFYNSIGAYFLGGSSSSHASINESQLLEASDGALHLYSRRKNTNFGFVRRTILGEGGLADGDATNTALAEPLNESSVLRLTHAGSPDAIVVAHANTHSHPWGLDPSDATTVECRDHDFRLRMRLTADISWDGGTSFLGGRVIREGSAGYSDMTELSNGDLGVLYEGPIGDSAYDRSRGAIPLTSDPDYNDRGISFARVRRDWLLAAQDEVAHVDECHPSVWALERARCGAPAMTPAAGGCSCLEGNCGILP